MRKRNTQQWFFLIFLLALTLIVDVFLLFWENIKKQEIFPGS